MASVIDKTPSKEVEISQDNIDLIEELMESFESEKNTDVKKVVWFKKYL